ncbi:MAG: ergothioneine biosynthesis protein EgtB [Gammaproteobacteria bacterium]|nr:ergothioneine biosynthesis protein EgtB [Gammaproteobacteria bacterium]MCP5202095.1 ergothioneine biosynthesis protein EgtB [Gammaproteobacteria bacterium]
MATPATRVDDDSTATRSALAARYAEVRAYSLALAAPLSAEDACVQSMADASPAKWHLAHVTWFFETFVLEAHEAGFAPHHPAFRELYNSYYNGIGPQYPRPRRGLVTRPSLEAVREYRAAVDARIADLLESTDLPAAALTTIELGLHHEQQHQELLLMDIKHLLSLNPLAPAYSETPLVPAAAAPALQWTAQAGGLRELGHDSASGFAFDNETPRHRAWLEPYALASRLVTNAEYLEFVDAGGYRDARPWLADGWATVNAEGWRAPLYWREIDGAWYEFTLHGLLPLDPARPVCHVSHYEADAYAQWRGLRLPTEFEWEAASPAPAAVQTPRLHPPAATTAGDDAYGSAWQWTASAYLPYPGFRAAAGAVGEYNGKFMSNQMSLRGSACLTPPGHARHTYRNFFYPHQRWAMTGIRLARDL